MVDQPVAPSAPEFEILRRTFYKTLSFQALGSIFDLTFGVVAGGELVIGGALALANIASDTALTYAHDLSWAAATRNSGMSEGDTRAARTTTHGVLNAAQCLGLGLLVTGSAAISAGYVAFNTVTDAAVYAANDWIWATLAADRAIGLAGCRGGAARQFVASSVVERRIVVSAGNGGENWIRPDDRL